MIAIIVPRGRWYLGQLPFAVGLVKNGFLLLPLLSFLFSVVIIYLFCNSLLADRRRVFLAMKRVVVLGAVALCTVVVAKCVGPILFEQRDY